MDSTVKFIENILKYTKRGIHADTYDELTNLLGWVNDLEISRDYFIMSYEDPNLVRIVNFEPKSEIGKWAFHCILDDLKKLN